MMINSEKNSQEILIKFQKLEPRLQPPYGIRLYGVRVRVRVPWVSTRHLASTATVCVIHVIIHAGKP